jgi:Protein of unknown function (DUF4229)
MSRRPGAGGPTGFGGSLAWYMTLRVALFAAALTVTVLLGVSGFLAFVIAVLASGLLSYPLARRQRDGVVESFRARRRIDR